MDHEGTSTSHLIKQQDHGFQLGHSSTTKKNTYFQNCSSKDKGFEAQCYVLCTEIACYVQNV